MATSAVILHYIYAYWQDKAWMHSDFRFVQEASDRYILDRHPDPLSYLRQGWENLARKY